MGDGCRRENRPGEPAGAEQPHGVPGGARAVRVGRPPGERRRDATYLCFCLRVESSAAGFSSSTLRLIKLMSDVLFVFMLLLFLAA